MSTVVPLVVSEALTKDYGHFRALDTLDLTIRPGEVFGLLGPNGSGKSTALRLMLGFMRPTGGRVRIAGFDSWEQSVDARRQIAYLPGELRLYENMTGRQLIRFLASLRNQSLGQEVDRLAKRLDIDIDKPLTQMSSGMKRKVALLSVLVPPVPVIILDEPTNTLDPTMRDELLHQLREAKGRGQTVLFSSHVLSEVERVCDRVGILQRGRLVHLQDMAELREGRIVRGRFAEPPAAGPDGTSLTRLPDGFVEFNHRGPLPPLLEWLSGQRVSDLRIEPAGLGPIYHRYHGNEV
jgi:beta-exotoxin I transport system ATP-binding protein